MSTAFIKGGNEHLPDAWLTFDKFHVLAHSSKAFDTVRRQQQKLDPQLKGVRWTLLKDANKLNLAQFTDLEALVSQYTTKRAARAWLYREQLRAILGRKQIRFVQALLHRWCNYVIRWKVEPKGRRDECFDGLTPSCARNCRGWPKRDISPSSDISPTADVNWMPRIACNSAQSDRTAR